MLCKYRDAAAALREREAWDEAVGGAGDGGSLFFLQKVKNQSLTFKGVYEFLA